MISHIYSLENPKKFTIPIKRILTKLISRHGLKLVQQCTPEQGQRLLHYIERAKNKERNAKERQRLLQLLGKEKAAQEEKEKLVMKKMRQADSDSDLEDEDSDMEQDLNEGKEQNMDADMEVDEQD